MMDKRNAQTLVHETLMGIAWVLLTFVIPPAGHAAGLVPIVDNPYKNYPHWHKGQIHAHSNESADGHHPPRVLEEYYKERGYDFICVTDHNRSTADPGVPGILHILSGEDGDNCRHHWLALAINLSKVDPKRDKDRDGIDGHASCPCKNIQPRLEYVTSIQQAVGVVGHPTSGHGHWPLCVRCDSGWTLGELLSYSKLYTGVEIYNAGSPDWSVDWWDQVLRRDERVWGFAGDDCHYIKKKRKKFKGPLITWTLEENFKSFNRGWIVVNSSLSAADHLRDPAKQKQLQDDIIENIKAGNFYSVVRSPEISGKSPGYGPSDHGPALNVSFSGRSVKVTTDRPSESIDFMVLKRTSSGRVVWEDHKHRGGRSASYELDGSEGYVRVEIAQRRPDGELYKAFSQPLFVMKRRLHGVVRVAGARAGIPGAKLEFRTEIQGDASKEGALGGATGRLPAEGIKHRPQTTDPRIATRTDGDGSYRISLPRTGRWDVTATHPNYKDYTGAVVITDGLQTLNVEMQRKGSRPGKRSPGGRAPGPTPTKRRLPGGLILPDAAKEKPNAGK
ncbi:MAG: hypothetical protein JSU68_03045 [Phycisphaerales bacterium]|nr:MAG: hypothetical protein JSU68_03045 [Phycisphaerales bacterium]